MSWKYFCGDFEDVILANLSKMLMVEFRISRLFKSLRSAVHDELFGGMAEQKTQLTFTCSKSTTETLEKEVKYVQS